MTTVATPSVPDPRFAPLAPRYFERTRRSREIARAGRTHLADPRSLMRLNPGWKGMDYPIVCEHSEGATLRDIDGNEYVDLTMGFGINLFGHRPGFVQEAALRRLHMGWHLAADVELSYSVAEQLCDLTGNERVLFNNTGSEAVMTAVRLARTVTERNLIAIFANSYHGWYDELFAKPATVGSPGQPTSGLLGDAVAGDGGARPGAPGVPPAATSSVVILDYCDPASIEKVQELGPRLAAVVVEPVQTRAPQLQPSQFLQELRNACDSTGAVLIFDEMITGFRIAAAGAQEYFGVRPDLCTYGKVLGGGMPIAAVAGRESLLAAADGGPAGYEDATKLKRPTTLIAGTYSRHPLALAAAESVLVHIAGEGAEMYQGLEQRSAKFAAALEERLADHEAPFEVARCASMVRVYGPDQALRELLSYHLVARGVYVSEGRTWFVSTAHEESDLDRVVAMLDDALSEMRGLW
jgi:glutamate-1-semialdehyde aminotransferase